MIGWILLLVVTGGRDDLPALHRGDLVQEARVAHIEINNKYQIKHRWPNIIERTHSLRQAVLWVDCDCTHIDCQGRRVDGWLMLDKNREPAVAAVGSGVVLVVVDDDGAIRRVKANSIETTHTWDDPEVTDRDIHPTEMRHACFQ